MLNASGKMPVDENYLNTPAAAAEFGVNLNATGPGDEDDEDDLEDDDDDDDDDDEDDE